MSVQDMPRHEDVADELFDVLIVGYGPTGSTLANLLGQAGRRVAVLDMFVDVFAQPRAINIDQEVLRTWQGVGLADEIAAGCEPHTGTDFVNADGELIKYLYSAPPPYPLGWPANLMFVQPEAEAVLRKGVARFPNVTEFLGHEVVSVAGGSDTVTVVAEYEGTTRTLTGKWLIGCDGANSVVRTQHGIGQEDLGFSEWWVVVDAWVRKQTSLPPRTTQFCYPDAPGAYVVCSGSLRRWEMKVLPGSDPEEYRDPQAVAERMRRYVDPDALDIWRSAVYHFHARVTDRWREGRVLLAGDAAHQMPPFLGQGLCSGIRDAANLAWKLDRVLRGLSGAELLDTYELERKPHIRALTALSKELGQIVGETDPRRAAVRDASLLAELRSGAMVTVRQNLIPKLAQGLVDPEDLSGLAGTLAVQPDLLVDGSRVRADDVSGTGVRVLTTTAPDQALRDAASRLGASVVHIGADGIQEVDPTFDDFTAQHSVASVVVRPDGYVWGAVADPASAAACLARLEQALAPSAQPSPTTNSGSPT